MKSDRDRYQLVCDYFVLFDHVTGWFESQVNLKKQHGTCLISETDLSDDACGYSR